MLVSKNYRYNHCTNRMQRKIPMNSMLGSSLILTDLHCTRRKWQAMLVAPASRLDGGQFPLVSPIPCHRSQHSRRFATCFYRCSAGPAGLQSQTSPAAASDSKRSRSTHGRPNSQTNVLKNTPTITVVQSIINFNN